MKKTGAGLFFLMLLLTGMQCMSQVTVDPGVIKKYERAVKRVPKEYAVMFTTKEGQKFGFGIFTFQETDTLNRNEFIPRMGRVEITSIDDKVINAKKNQKKANGDLYSNGSNTCFPLFMAAIVKDDTLHTRLPWVFEPAIETDITPHSVTAVLKEYLKYDSVFRTSLNEPKQSSIRIPMNISNFTISDTVFREGGTIYGEAEMKTLPYYVDDMNFTTGYIKKQMHYKYVFRLEIIATRF